MDLLLTSCEKVDTLAQTDADTLKSIENTNSKLIGENPNSKVIGETASYQVLLPIIIQNWYILGPWSCRIYGTSSTNVSVTMVGKWAPLFCSLLQGLGTRFP